MTCGELESYRGVIEETNGVIQRELMTSWVRVVAVGMERSRWHTNLLYFE